MADLTTLEAVKRYLKLDRAVPPPENPFLHDAELTRLIAAVSKKVRTDAGRALDVPAAARTEHHDGDGGTVLILDEYPVASVASVVVDGGTPIPVRPTPTDAGYVLADPAIGKIVLVGYAFTRGVQNVAVTYSAGWATVPEDLEQAVIELVALAFTDEDHVGQSYRNVGGEVVDFRGGAQLAHAREVVNSYRRICVG